jgi:hypothetical protein
LFEIISSAMPQIATINNNPPKTLLFKSEEKTLVKMRKIKRIDAPINDGIDPFIKKSKTPSKSNIPRCQKLPKTTLCLFLFKSDLDLAFSFLFPDFYN